MKRSVRSTETFMARVEMVSRGKFVLATNCDPALLVKFVGAEQVLVTLQADTPDEDELHPAGQAR